MYLKRLDIQGFKTFAARTAIEFRPGITAVVGPNGSGKSNIADAVRWVLGEQSLATLRCKRSEELIFAGSGRRSPAGLAEVALTIDNSDRLLPLDFDEVTIARRATRAGDSEYFINRARVRLRDVQAATEPLGGSYTIINQGLVDAALTLRPEERRRLFEDAAEIGGFEVRKAEALRRLRETDSNLQRVGDLLGELEPRLRSLKRQAGQARQHRELSIELRRLQMRHYADLWRAAQSHAARTRADAADLESALDHARAAQLEVSSTLRALREALRGRRDDLGALHQRSGALHRRAESAQRALAVDGERLSALARRAEELERRRNELSLRQGEDEARRRTAADEVAQAESALDAQRAALHVAEAALAESDLARHTLARELRTAQDASVRAATAVAEGINRAEQLRAQAARLDHDGAELDVAAAQAAEHLTTAAAQVEAERAEVARAEVSRAAAAEAEHVVRAELDTARAARAAADDDLAAARRALADAEARLDSLNRLARSYAGAFAGVRAAMQWAEKANRPGFALVQSIIRTPAELETAVEVALGSRLQNIVVTHWEDAEEVIADLQRSGVGRATFMPLDSLRSQRIEHETLSIVHAQSSILNPQSPVFGIAADLVDYDERYAAVVQQLLGRVLIVRDMAIARAELRRLSGGWTIVTLQGEQVSSGGSVTGGAQTKERGALRRERELRELPGRVDAARAAVDRAEARRVDLEAQSQGLAQRLREFESHVRDAARQVESRRAGLDDAGRRLAQAEQERSWAAQRQERLARDLVALRGQEVELAGVRAVAEAIAVSAETHLAELRARQDAETQADRVAQGRVAGLRATVGSAEGQLRAERTLLATHERRLAEGARQMADAAITITDLEIEREQIGATHARVAAEQHELLAGIDALRAQIDPAEAALRADESLQADLERREQSATATLLDREAAHSRAALEAQRAGDRQDALYERAAADNIDVEAAEPQAEDAPGAYPDNLQAEIDALKTKILRLGAVNQLALEEYEETAVRHRFLSEQVSDLRKAEDSLLELIAALDDAMRQRFINTFNAVAAEFEQSFVRLFGGGSAKLLLTGGPSGNGHMPEDDTGESAGGGRDLGVEIIVRPPGKKQQSISLLSGGERTLTAAALLFAILKVNPSPFCILDETDAALDESNVGRFRDALQVLADQTQFILITHNRGTIEAADSLYGVTMGEDGASRTISLQVEAYVRG
ncbi:MAG: chromosome segregation protein SMC [Chloroflexales bacterium]